MSLIASVSRLDFDVLNDDRLIIKPHGIGRKRGRIDGTLDRIVDG